MSLKTWEQLVEHMGPAMRLKVAESLEAQAKRDARRAKALRFSLMTEDEKAQQQLSEIDHLAEHIADYHGGYEKVSKETGRPLAAWLLDVGYRKGVH